jgi:hypothetical protein
MCCLSAPLIATLGGDMNIISLLPLEEFLRWLIHGA